MRALNISNFLGKTFSSVNVNYDDNVIRFIVDENESYSMYHDQDCCENVSINDINGDINDLIDSPITLAEESSNRGNDEDDWGGTFTWTFYRLATVKGYVDIRWYGSSNGYYSESVDIYRDRK
jgi:hypothetical protein